MRVALQRLAIRESSLRHSFLRSIPRPPLGKKMSAVATSSDWSKQDERRMLHAVYRVGNLKDYVEWAKDCLGMKVLRYREVPEEKYANAFLGYGPEDTHFALELTENFGVDSYDIGEGFGHFGVALAPPQKVYDTCEAAKSKGYKVTREAGPVKGGTTTIAFIQDPSGYSWELIGRDTSEPIREPLAQVMLRVGDLERSIKFYTEALGMRLLRTRENEQYKYTLAFLGYGDEADSTVFELTYNWGRSEYSKGNAYAQVAISTKDVYKTAEQIREAGGNITRDPGPIPGINTKITACLDPDGYKLVFVDEEDFKKELVDASDDMP